MIIEFEPKLTDFKDRLMETKSSQSRVYLVYARTVCYLRNRAIWGASTLHMIELLPFFPHDLLMLDISLIFLPTS
uniref:Uncharacterized protein n=1 Tax=Megaselia scalaris TaxID=36166 RepID=T1GG65_MEGSC